MPSDTKTYQEETYAQSKPPQPHRLGGFCALPRRQAAVFLQKTGMMNKITLIYQPVYSILDTMVSVLASAGHKNGRRAKELGNELRD